MTLTLERCVHALEVNEMPHAVLPLQNGVRLLLTAYGGRILGPFLPEGGPGLYWASPVLGDPAALGEFVAAHEWNLGGERVWIAPEIQYTATDRADFWGTYSLPRTMEPGRHTLAPGGLDHWVWRQEIELEAHNLAAGQKQLHLVREIYAAPDPLRHLAAYSGLLSGVIYAGYAHVMTLHDANPNTIQSATWNLIQLQPGGELVIGTTAPVEYAEYFGNDGAEHLRIEAHTARVKITGQQQFKLGFAATHVTGRLAYLNRLDDERSVLIVRHFDCNPASAYLEEPPELPGRNGHAVHVYNDDGKLGGFGEMECQGQAVGGIDPYGRTRKDSTDVMHVWLYVGAADRLRIILQQLVG